MSRKQEFLETGARLAAKVGAKNVTRRAIAAEHDVSDPLVGKHVGGKAELQKGIKSAMKKLGLSEPADALAKGKALRARKLPATVQKKATPAKKSSGPATVGVRKATSAKKATPAKKSVAKKVSSAAGNASSKGLPSPASRKKPATAIPADPKKGAPSRKVVKKAPANKAKFPTKIAPPPLPALPVIE